ncbi:hypothetical protein PIB30_067238 [Stylosanthes scabra]|uniref:Uncharacterized protein n=1 Tax=Stylosanthes scabra TaxID=79078 RepID=A0ABU6YN36_9FABA|nr:hypothetical protein [Stylosanthes scabra]
MVHSPQGMWKLCVSGRQRSTNALTNGSSNLNHCWLRRANGSNPTVDYMEHLGRLSAQLVRTHASLVRPHESEELLTSRLTVRPHGSVRNKLNEAKIGISSFRAKVKPL